MKVLSIGTDRNVFHEGGEARARQKAYAQALGSMDLIVFSTEKRDKIVDGPLTILPTNSSSRWRYVADAIRIARTRKDADIVTAQDPFETGFVGARVAKRLKVPLHVQVHTDIGAPAFAESSKLNRIRLIIARYVLRSAARVRAVSERVGNALVQMYGVRPEKISILPIFVDTERYKNAEAPAVLLERFKDFSKVALVVSRLEPEKNVAQAVRAFLESAPSDACLIVLGTGSEEGKLLREFRFAPNVLFEGMQDPAPYYKLADIVLVPSLYEGYGRTIVEALAAQAAVLSTDVGVAREAGATVASAEGFAAALKEWFERGGSSGHLTAYPYKNFDDYVVAYRDDIAACAGA